MIVLSYTTIDDFYRCGHSYLNKIHGRKKPETPYMTSGKENHKIIQDHCLGIKDDPRLSALTWRFQKSEVHIQKTYDDQYLLHGYADMADYKTKKFSEIKISSTPWGLSRFRDLMQRKYYGYLSKFLKVYCITGTHDLSVIKRYELPITDSDREEAHQWVSEAIKKISAGEYCGGLDENHICIDPRCPYGVNCKYRRQDGEVYNA